MKLKIVKDRRWPGSYYLPPDDIVSPHSINIDPDYPVTDRERMFVALHEIGHAYCKHTWRNIDTPTAQIMKEEKDAWNYARRCVKVKYHKEFDKFVKKRLGDAEIYYNFKKEK